MTGYTVHTGTTVKFAGGWDRVFSGKKGANPAAATKKPASKQPAAKAKKKSAKPAAKKSRRTKRR